MSEISKDFENLCEKEFSLARRQAYDGLDREIMAIKHRMASTGNAFGSAMAHAVVDASPHLWTNCVIGETDAATPGAPKEHRDGWNGPSINFSTSE